MTEAKSSSKPNKHNPLDFLYLPLLEHGPTQKVLILNPKDRLVGTKLPSDHVDEADWPIVSARASRWLNFPPMGVVYFSIPASSGVSLVADVPVIFVNLDKYWRD